MTRHHSTRPSNPSHGTVANVSAPSASEARRSLLEMIRGVDHFDRAWIIAEACRRLGPVGNHQDTQRRIMDAWDELYRDGIILYGHNLANLGMGFAHLTEFGAEALAQPERDPGNVPGYKAAVAPYVADQPIARSYLDEALVTYNRGAYKAAAVMLGGAAEAFT